MHALLHLYCSALMPLSSFSYCSLQKQDFGEQIQLMGRLFVVEYDSDKMIIVCRFCHTHIVLQEHMLFNAPGTILPFREHPFSNVVNVVDDETPVNWGIFMSTSTYCISCGSNLGIRYVCKNDLRFSILDHTIISWRMVLLWDGEQMREVVPNRREMFD